MPGEIYQFFDRLTFLFIKCNTEEVGEVTLLSNKTVPFHNMYRVNTGFHVKIQGNLQYFMCEWGNGTKFME